LRSRAPGRRHRREAEHGSESAAPPSRGGAAAAGNRFVSDQGNCVVHKVDLNRIITTVAGTPGSCDDSGDGGPATAARIVPSGIAVALYVADKSSVRKVAGGIITTMAGQTAPYFTDPSPGVGSPVTAAGFGGQAVECAGAQHRRGDPLHR